MNLSEEYKSIIQLPLESDMTLTQFFEKFKRYPVIAVTGPAGTGKTTLTKIIAEYYGAKILSETPEINPFLAIIGRTKGQIDELWYPNQSLFLAQDSGIITDGFMRSDKHSIVFDFAITQTKAYAELKLKGKESINFMNTFDGLFHGTNNGFTGLPVPDIVIEVKSDTDVIVKRREARGKWVDNQFEDEVGEMNEKYANGYVKNHYPNVEEFDNSQEKSEEELIMQVNQFLQKLSQ